MKKHWIHTEISGIIVLRLSIFWVVGLYIKSPHLLKQSSLCVIVQVVLQWKRSVLLKIFTSSIWQLLFVHFNLNFIWLFDKNWQDLCKYRSESHRAGPQRQQRNLAESPPTLSVSPKWFLSMQNLIRCHAPYVSKILQNLET